MDFKAQGKEPRPSGAVYSRQKIATFVTVTILLISIGFFSHVTQRPEQLYQDLAHPNVAASHDELDTHTDSSNHHKRVALNFFGLTRSLTHTYPSIQQRLIRPILRAGYKVDIFLHTYNVSRLDNPWSLEHVWLNTTEWTLLNPLDVLVTSQEQFLEANQDRIERCTATGNGWPTGKNFQTTYNLLCQLNSVYEVSRLWQKQHALTPYHAVIYARPDVIYNCRFPVHFLDHIQVR